MSKLTDWVLDLLFPTRCILCRDLIDPGRPRICSRCQSSMPTAEGCRRKGDYFSDCVSALHYRGAVQEAIRRYKFEGAQAYDEAFGELVAERIYADLFGRFDILSWVPLAPDRFRDRGYDQSWLLAANVGKRLEWPVTPLLKKRRGVHAQSLTGSPAARKANIAGAYTVLDPKTVEGKRVLLVDDIVTSGSTLSECAKTLLKAGADEIMCATLAVAGDS